MTKRDAPHSGFDITKSPKRHLLKQTSPSHSIGENPSNVTSTHADTPYSLSHEPSDDIFIPDPQPGDSVKDHVEFVPTDKQRNEIAAELVHLQAPPTNTIDQVSSPPDRTEQEDDDDQQEEQTTLQSSPTGKRQNQKKQFNGKHVRKAYMDPLFWPEGLPDHAAIQVARLSNSLVCGTTNISLNTETLPVNGTVWKEILADEMPELLRDNDEIPFPPEQDAFDFLKASLRLGSFVEPHHMSRLLGERYRSPEYCSFLLQGFLGLLHNSKVRRVLREDSPEHPPQVHTDIVVTADHLYPSDDELIRDQEASATNTQEENIPLAAEPKVAIIEDSDREEDESHTDPPSAHNSAVHEFSHKSSAEHRFLAEPSYVLRNYMSIISGREIKDLDEFESYLSKVGATVVADPRKEPLTRLKWLKEKMPAPSMGREAAVSEPLSLWNHAMKTYSRRNLARCALIKTNTLLDWLGFVANETTVATSEKEYYEDNRPVVAVAPVPTLHLADKAVDFVLRVLTVAVQTEELSLNGAGQETDHILIGEYDVTSAAHELADDPDMKRGLFMSEFVHVLGNEGTYNDEWPSLLQRPLTRHETIKLCDRSPEALISVPTAIMEEMRAVVMSFRQVIKPKIYAKQRLIKAKDPLQFMSGPEKAASSDRRRQYNNAYGISWFKPAERKSGEESENKSHEDTASGFKIEPQDKSQARTITGQEESTKDEPPVDGQKGPSNLSPRLKPPIERKDGLPDFFDQVNFAELAAFRLGKEEIQKRKDAANNVGFEDPTESSDDAALLLTESKDGRVCTTASVCFHRLGWICLHALGVSLEKTPDDVRPIGYGSLANYTNFGQFRGGKPVALTSKALSCLVKIADMIVRSEGEILMSCATHDDGRPWIDRADVALVTSVRKELFHYSDL